MVLRVPEANGKGRARALALAAVTLRTSRGARPGQRVRRGYFGTDGANIEIIGVQIDQGTKGLIAIRSRKNCLSTHSCLFYRWLHRCFSRFGGSGRLRKAGKLQGREGREGRA